MIERYLSAPETASILKLSTQGVYGLIKRGELPVAATTEGGTYLFRREEVERVAVEREARPKRRGAFAALPQTVEGGTA